ncbi:MAG: winged helix-turn-helix transcriptional regulator [Sandaracinaceae bacterium]
MRTYGHFCGVAKALDVLGDRWTLLIVRDLLLGPRRYTDLHVGLPGITTNLLAKRLREMRDAGLVEKRVEPPPSASTVYVLTDRGRELEPVVLALGRWGARYLDAPGDDVTRPRWAMVSLMRRYRGYADGAANGYTIAYRVGDEPYALRLDPVRLEVRDGVPVDADLRLSSDAPTFFRLISRRLGAAALIESGALRVEGSVELLLTLVPALSLIP